ncbi:MAG: hypothetical protein IPH03_11745 [Tetrasphaera sp.]|nr:hypothetical protein [Tetrasphaera sp.]
MVGQTDMAGYIRVLSPPSCDRCSVLGGKWFKWNTGFARHPGCDCKHVPAGRGGRRPPPAARRGTDTAVGSTTGLATPGPLTD